MPAEFGENLNQNDDTELSCNRLTSCNFTNKLHVLLVESYSLLVMI